MLKRFGLITFSLAFGVLLGQFKSTTWVQHFSSQSPRVAKTQSTARAGQPSQASKSVQAEALISFSDYRYEEKNMSVEGALWGLSAAVGYALDSGVTIVGRGEFASGETSYNGQYLDIYETGNRSKVSGSAKDQIYDLGLLADVQLLRDFRSKTTLFSGLAYRYVDNKIKVPGGYAREISQFYLPLGAKTEYAFSRDWKILAEGEFNYLVSGNTTSHLRDVGPEYSDLTHHQDRGMGFRAQLRAHYRLSGFSLLFGPYYSYWKVEESDRVATTINGTERYFIEPQNTTTRLGFSLGVFY